MRNRRKFKLKKSMIKGHKVNDRSTCLNKRKHTAVFHLIKDLHDKLDKLDLNDL